MTNPLYSKLTDYHAHTSRCNHATGTMREYVERAREIGLAEFGFSEHSPWMITPTHGRYCPTYEEMPDYVDDVRRLQAEYNDANRFQIRLGIEMDYVPTRLAVAREMAERFDWDFVVGSYHHLGLWGLPGSREVENYDLYGMDNICELYFDAVGRMIDERFCDVIGHLDVIKRFGHIDDAALLPWVEPLIPRIKANDIVVEVNTSGMDYACAEVFPGWQILDALIAADVPLMINSDAHAPEHVGRHFEPTLRRLMDMGVRRLIRFQRRRPLEFEIDAACLSP